MDRPWQALEAQFRYYVFKKALKGRQRSLQEMSSAKWVCPMKYKEKAQLVMEMWEIENP